MRRYAELGVAAVTVGGAMLTGAGYSSFAGWAKGHELPTGLLMPSVIEMASSGVYTMPVVALLPLAAASVPLAFYTWSARLPPRPKPRPLWTMVLATIIVVTALGYCIWFAVWNWRDFLEMTPRSIFISAIIICAGASVAYIGGFQALQKVTIGVTFLLLLHLPMALIKQFSLEAAQASIAKIEPKETVVRYDDGSEIVVIGEMVTSTATHLAFHDGKHPLILSLSGVREIFPKPRD